MRISRPEFSNPASIKNSGWSRLRLRQHLSAAVLIGASLLWAQANANPDGPTVVAGSAEIATLGNALNISNSPGTIINWREFSIGQSEITRFLQQGNQSAILNRVTGATTSTLQGQLLSNGRVFLVNPNGIVVGNGARIDTAGFVASTLGISDSDFVAGNYHFRGNGGAIINNGTITGGPGGEVVLIAPVIENGGAIQVLGGEIVLAAGREVALTSLSDANISFRVSAPGDHVVNLGSLLAQDGAIGLFANQVNNQGQITANRVGHNGKGQIVLFGDGSTTVSGNVTAMGSNTVGGDIQIAGSNIQLNGASVDASGNSGGRVAIGGSFQGRGNLPRATRTGIDPGSVVHADAITQGPGGEIVVTSDFNTQSLGRLTARGGSNNGNGGRIETSSGGSLEIGQIPIVSATAGAPGTWTKTP